MHLTSYKPRGLGKLTIAKKKQRSIKAIMAKARKKSNTASSAGASEGIAINSKSIDIVEASAPHDVPVDKPPDDSDPNEARNAVVLSKKDPYWKRVLKQIKATFTHVGDKVVPRDGRKTQALQLRKKHEFKAPDQAIISAQDTSLKQLNPDDWTQLDVFLWFPLAQYCEPVICPRCKNPATFKQWPEKPREAVMDDRLVHILAPRYRCDCIASENIVDSRGKKTFETTFSCYDSQVLAGFTDATRRKYPYFHTHQNSISSRVIDGLVACMASSQSIGNFAQNLTGVHEKRRMEVELQYYKRDQMRMEKIEDYNKKLQIPRSLGAFAALPKPLSPSPRIDTNRSSDFVLSESFLISVWLDYFTCAKVIPGKDGTLSLTLEEFLNRRMQLLTGSVWKVDGSHKVSKLIRCTFTNTTSGKGEDFNPMEGIFTILNEYGEVIFQQPMLTMDFAGLEKGLKDMLNLRYKSRGVPLPLVIYTDNCCLDRSFFEKLFSDVDASYASPNVRLSETLPILELAPSAVVTVFEFEESDDKAKMMVRSIKAKLKAATRHNVTMRGSICPISLDLEWNSGDRSGRGSGTKVDRTPALVQLCLFDGSVYVWRIAQDYNIRSGTLKVHVPDALKQLLRDPTYTFVGRNIKGDQTKIANMKVPGFELKNILDVGAVAVKLRDSGHLVIPGLNAIKSYGHMSLQWLCETIARKTLKKENFVRLSHWSGIEKLSSDQRTYAAIDAYAGMLIYEAICDYTYPAATSAHSSDFQSGDEVHVICHEKVVALGVVQEKSRTFGNMFVTRGSRRGHIVKITEALDPDALLQYGVEEAPFNVCTYKELLECASGEKRALCDRNTLRLKSKWKHNSTPELYTGVSAGKGVEHDNWFADLSVRKMELGTGILELADDVDVNAVLQDELCGVYDTFIVDDDDDSSDTTTAAADSISESKEDPAESKETATPLLPDPKDGRSLPEIIESDEAWLKSIVEVLLDPFHAMQRISKKLYKKHGAFIIFMKRFRDAVFLLDADDVKRIEKYLKETKKLTPEETEEYKLTNWNFFVKHR